MEGFYKKFLIYITILILASMITLFTFDSYQTVMIISLLLICISYIFILGIDKLSVINCGSIKEGFVTESEKSKYEWLTTDDLFDDFYASVFTKLTQNDKLVQAETAICMEEFTKNASKDHKIIGGLPGICLLSNEPWIMQHSIAREGGPSDSGQSKCRIPY